MTSKAKALKAREHQLSQSDKLVAAREGRVAQQEAAVSRKELDVSSKERGLFEKQQAVSTREAGVSEAEGRVSAEARRLKGLSEELGRSKRDADEREKRYTSIYKVTVSDSGGSVDTYLWG